MVWGKIILFVVAVFVVMFIFNKIMAKVLNVEKKSIFSNRYVNDLHKKMDWILRILFIIAWIIFNFSQHDPITPSNYSPWHFLGVLMVYFVVDELVRAFMEWKYAANRKDYIYTLSEMVLMLILIFALVQTDFLGLIN